MEVIFGILPLNVIHKSRQVLMTDFDSSFQHILFLICQITLVFTAVKIFEIDGSVNCEYTVQRLRY